MTDPLRLELAAALPGRDAARDAARRELSRRVYADARPGIVSRILSAIARFIRRLFEHDGGAGHGFGTLGYVVVVLLLLGLVALVAWRLGPVRRRRTAEDQMFDLPPGASADGLRAEADAHAAAGRWAEALRARLRAVVLDLEDRGVLDPRPGRTAGEVAREASAAVPHLARPLADATRVFSEVWYGRREATRHDDELVATLDREQRRRRVPTAATRTDQPAVPA